MAYSPRDVVRRHRDVDRVPHPAQHVEVGQRRLHHHDVGALLDVEQRLADALAGVGGSPAGRCAGRPRARSRRPRGTGRRTRRRTSRSRPGSPTSVWPAPSRADRTTATWPSIIPLGPTMWTPAAAWATGHLGVHLQRRVVVDPAVGGEHAAVAVVGELVEAQVAHHHDRVADLGDDVGDRDVEDPVGVERAGAGGVLRLRDAEQHDAAEPGLGRLGGRLAQRVAGVLDDAGHRARSAGARRSPRARTSAAPAGAARSEVSATSRRSAGVVRSRRGRMTGPTTSSVIARSSPSGAPTASGRTAW